MTEAGLVHVPDEIDGLREEFSRLVFEKDRLLGQDSQRLSAEYMNRVGAKELALWRLNGDLSRAVRKLELVRACMARGEVPDIEAIDSQLDEVFSDFMRELKERDREFREAMSYGSGRPLSDEESRELRDLYRKIVKRLHPDINPGVTADDLALFDSAVQAFKCGDLDKVRAIYWNTPDAPGTGMSAADLKIRILQLKEDIAKIKSIYPFDKIGFLNDPDAVRARNLELDEQIHRSSVQYDEVLRTIEGLERSL